MEYIAKQPVNWKIWTEKCFKLDVCEAGTT